MQSQQSVTAHLLFSRVEQDGRVSMGLCDSLAEGIEPN
jgi:hypothetical protein